MYVCVYISLAKNHFPIRFDTIGFVAIKFVAHNTIVFKKCSSTKIRHSQIRINTFACIHCERESAIWLRAAMKKKWMTWVKKRERKTYTSNRWISNVLYHTACGKYLIFINHLCFPLSCFSSILFIRISAWTIVIRLSFGFKWKLCFFDKLLTSNFDFHLK